MMDQSKSRSLQLKIYHHRTSILMQSAIGLAVGRSCFDHFLIKHYKCRCQEFFLRSMVKGIVDQCIINNNQGRSYRTSQTLYPHKHLEIELYLFFRSKTQRLRSLYLFEAITSAVFHRYSRNYYPELFIDVR